MSDQEALLALMTDWYEEDEDLDDLARRIVAAGFVRNTDGTELYRRAFEFMTCEGVFKSLPLEKRARLLLGEDDKLVSGTRTDEGAVF